LSSIFIRVGLVLRSLIPYLLDHTPFRCMTYMRLTLFQLIEIPHL
jgi:hypothetical protein